MLSILSMKQHNIEASSQRISLTQTLSSLGDVRNTIFSDDIITIRCSNGATVEPFIFRIAKSALDRSPTFTAFFNSEYYVPNCDMLISFMIDPAAVFDIVKRYLVEGPDTFDLTTLRVHLYRRYNTMERETVLVRLCRMAHNMGLGYLHEMAYDILIDENRFITAPMLPTLAGLIFGSRQNYHEKIKDWCLLHIGHHFLELKTSRQWANCLRVSEQCLSIEWGKMVEQNEEILFTLGNYSDEKILESRIHRMSFQDQDRAISVMGEKKAQDDNTADELARSTMLKKDRVDDNNLEEEWEDVDTPSSGANVATRLSKSNSGTTEDEDDATTLGARETSSNDGTNGSTAAGPERRSPTENAKARQIMGIDAGGMSPQLGKECKKLRRKRGKIEKILGSTSSMSLGSPKRGDKA